MTSETVNFSDMTRGAPLLLVLRATGLAEVRGRRTKTRPISGRPAFAAPPLADASARRHRPDDLDLVAADAIDLVEHVADDAGMVGDDADHLADLRLGGRAREVDHAVLFGNVGDHRVRILHHAAEILDVVLLARQHL